MRVSTPEERMDLAAVLDSVRRAAIDMISSLLVTMVAFYESCIIIVGFGKVRQRSLDSYLFLRSRA